MWYAKPTGDMTLSVIDENGFQIVKVDMLAQNTMAAGLEGDKLAQTLNDLSVIASFANDCNLIDIELPYEDISVSDVPWTASYDETKRKLVIKSKNGKIADRVFPKSLTQKQIKNIVDVIFNGIDRVNTTYKSKANIN